MVNYAAIDFGSNSTRILIASVENKIIEKKTFLELIDFLFLKRKDRDFFFLFPVKYIAFIIIYNLS